MHANSLCCGVVTPDCGSADHGAGAVTSGDHRLGWAGLGWAGLGWLPTIGPGVVTLPLVTAHPSSFSCQTLNLQIRSSSAVQQSSTKWDKNGADLKGLESGVQICAVLSAPSVSRQCSRGRAPGRCGGDTTGGNLAAPGEPGQVAVYSVQYSAVQWCTVHTRPPVGIRALPVRHGVSTSCHCS